MDCDLQNGFWLPFASLRQLFNGISFPGSQAGHIPLCGFSALGAFLRDWRLIPQPEPWGFCSQYDSGQGLDCAGGYLSRRP